ncbi:MAG TPA: mechanosensitive ion channel family protein [Rhodospirillales bacterium]|nr:mechanosensitive ion channel family protein [Rhodospirillales bacterium]
MAHSRTRAGIGGGTRAGREPSGESRTIRERTRRILPVVLLLVPLLFATLGAGAQTPPGTTADDGAGGSGDATQRVDAALRQLITVLEDPGARERLLEALRRLETGAPQEAPSGEAEREGALLLRGFEEAVRERVAVTVRALGELAGSYRQIGFLYAWLRRELGDPEGRAFLLGNLLRLALAALVGLFGAFAARLSLRRFRPVPEPGASSPARHRLQLAARVVACRFATAAAFVVAAYLFVLVVSETPLLAILARHVLIGVLVGRSVAALVDAVLAPDRPERRLVALEDATARSLAHWMTALNAIVVYGATALRAAWDLGLPWTIYGFLLRALYLVAVVVALALLWRYRQPVADALEARVAASGTAVARFLPWPRLLRSWHLLLGGLLLLHYLAFALDLPGGFLGFLSSTVLSLLLLALARFAWLSVDHLLDSLAPPSEEEGTVGGPPPRSRLYLRLLRFAARGVILLLAVLLLADAWGLGLTSWLLTGPGRAVVGQFLRLFAVLAIALLLAEAVSAVAGHYMRATTADGRPLYGNRTRTLASIARNAAVALIAVIALMTVLSQLGIETGPLLAGAGIVGLAVGFGSQKLVQDLITGLFILLGDTIRVGDVVDTGGKAGVVEAMSMRTITLRGYDGNVHTVPYSSIDTVTNMTKDFAYWVMDIGVAYQEDVDRVMGVLRELDEEMRREWPWRRLVLAPIDIAGLDRFGDSAVVIKARLKTRPGEQWGVGREFQRRMKKRFDELGIEIPFPHRTIYFGVDKEGRAPPVYVRTLDAADDRTAGANTGSGPEGTAGR